MAAVAAAVAAAVVAVAVAVIAIAVIAIAGAGRACLERTVMVEVLSAVMPAVAAETLGVGIA